MTDTIHLVHMARTNAELADWRRAVLEDNPRAKIALVPTMGALHRGHLALVEAAKALADNVVVSIFVNPLQFGANEDFSRYPRHLSEDAELLSQLGVDLIFNPDVSEIYPEGLESVTRVVPPEHLTNRLCGAFRPGHFTGVATVVNKLFNLVKPSIAYFGQKDYQQLVIISTMVKDLNIDIEIKGIPIVREEDELALSSRNVYLSPRERALAPELHKTLKKVRDELLLKQKRLPQILSQAQQQLEQGGAFAVQYLECCHPQTLSALESLNDESDEIVILIAAKLGQVRLIDNLAFKSRELP